MMDARPSCKCVVIGDGGVGKTCMLISFTENKFPSEYIPTVFDSYVCTMKGVDLQLWDTAGQEDYADLRPLSYENTNIFLMCFNLTNKDSLENVRSLWFPEIKPHLLKAQGSSEKIAAVLVGTKADLRDSKPDSENYVSSEAGRKVAKELGVQYHECSALTGKGLKQVFNSVVDLFRDIKGDMLEEKPKKTQSTGGCCIVS